MNWSILLGILMLIMLMCGLFFLEWLLISWMIAYPTIDDCKSLWHSVNEEPTKAGDYWAKLKNGQYTLITWGKVSGSVAWKKWAEMCDIEMWLSLDDLKLPKK